MLEMQERGFVNAAAAVIVQDNVAPSLPSSFPMSSPES